MKIMICINKIKSNLFLSKIIKKNKNLSNCNYINNEFDFKRKLMKLNNNNNFYKNNFNQKKFNKKVMKKKKTNKNNQTTFLLSLMN